MEMEWTSGGQQLDSWVQPWKNHVALLLDRTTPKAHATAGVGLVLDTRQAAALAAGRAIEKELAELRGHATPVDHDCGGELQVVGATQSPELRDLNERLGKALVEQQAAKEENSVVVSRQHVQGAAFRSGRICNGDIVAKVDGIPIGAGVECIKSSKQTVKITSLPLRTTVRQSPFLNTLSPFRTTTIRLIRGALPCSI